MFRDSDGLRCGVCGAASVLQIHESLVDVFTLDRNFVVECRQLFVCRCDLIDERADGADARRDLRICRGDIRVTRIRRRWRYGRGHGRRPDDQDPTTPNPMTSCARRIDLREGPRRDSPPRVTCLTNNSPSRVTPRPAGSPIRAGRECADQAPVAHSPRAARRPGRVVRTPPSTPREQGNRQVRVEQHQPVCDTSSPKSASCTVRHSSVLWKL